MAQSSELQIEGTSGGNFSVLRLARGGASETERVRLEAVELARALAAQTIVLADDAVVEELPDRMRAIRETMWPSAPLEGYQLHASLGAYLVAKVAVSWAPSGPVGLRHEPLDREGLLEDLAERGVSRPRALRTLGDFSRVDASFTPDPMGLDTSRLAGLAEGTLSGRERSRALSQVASSTRCLNRLASVLNVLSTLRTVLPFLPPESFGPHHLAATVALALDRPGRALELLAGRRDTLALRTLAEIASAMLEVERGEPPSPSDEGLIAAPDLEPDADRDPESGASASPESNSNDSEDVLEIVEERVENRPKGAAPPPPPGAARGVPKPARFGAPGEPAPIDPHDLEAWTARVRALAGPVARGNVLGLAVLPSDETHIAWPLPPDERVLALALAGDPDAASAAFSDELQAVPLSGSPLDAVFPVARGLVRLIASAFEGRGPADAAVAAAGDVRANLLRARALARIVEGDLEAAYEAVRTLPVREAPEATFAQDRLRRFRRSVAPSQDERQMLAWQLLRDVARQLGRTLAQTVFVPESSERR